MRRNMRLAYLANQACWRTAACLYRSGQHAHFQVSQDCAALSNACMSRKSDFQPELLYIPFCLLFYYFIYSKIN